ncbi:MAG: serine/threonine protein kinase [Myxococcaceae bacterium]|nr:serine/threonine protein kinase [Myxococcaceae bacterium]
MSPADDTTISRPKPADFIPGYRLDKLVGKGGMGEVYQAVQLSLGRTVAIKVLAAELATDANFVARFDKEGTALAALRHPHIVSIVDKGRNENTYYLVMEFVDGPSLREVLRSPLLDAGQSLRMFMQICNAIDYAHGRGVIHRDLKPENILFDEQAGGIAKVTDFGLAGFDERAGMRALNLTQTNMAMGTASYMAPEQRTDAKSADHRADIYALGVLLYEMLVGEVPVGNFDLPSVRKPKLDRRLDAVVKRCLKPTPEERYSSMKEMLADLEPLGPVTSVLSNARTTPLQRFKLRAAKWARRTVRATAAVVVLFAMVLIGAAYARHDAREKRQPAGIELTTDFGGKWPMTTPGRFDFTNRTLALGEGPDSIPVVALGRQIELKGDRIRFAPGEGAVAGRAVVDQAVPGAGLEVTVEAQLPKRQASRWDPLKAMFFGPAPDPRAALMLVGEPGRFVALVIDGSGAEPTLEWALGSEKRGTLAAPLSLPEGFVQLTLRVDPQTGDLSALIGKDRDERMLGDVLSLGMKWKELFGEPPRAAVGCLEGSCGFSQVHARGLQPPPVIVAEPIETEEVKEPPSATATSTKKVTRNPPPIPPLKATVKKKPSGPARKK